MKVEMNSDGLIDITGVNVDQIGMLVHALKASPRQDFMDDPELSKMFKLLAILQSEVFHDMTSGKIDLSQFKQVE